jgi:uncharacterized protein YdeI (YjbR/CyaY-like superfamily)
MFHAVASKLDALERVEFESREALRAWLEAHHERSPGIWLVTFRKDSGRGRLPYDEVVEELLCVGWVDSLPRKLDEARTMLLCTPRKPSSAWSKPNKERVARLEAQGLMRPRGVAVVEAARASGKWTALDDVEALIEPPELQAALDAVPAARQSWDEFPRSAKRGILEWIVQAKAPETRARRVAETVRRAAVGERANQWRR